MPSCITAPLRDFKKLHEMSDNRKRFAVIGSGFIGSEIAAALAMNGKEVVLFDIGPGIGWIVFPDDMTEYLNRYYQDKGVEIVTNVKVTNVEKAGDKYKLSLNSGQSYEVDGVVAGVGIMPDTDLAEALQLKVDNGIHVNEFLQTTDPDIYAAGDVANFYNSLLGRRIRVEHADNATSMGKAAGRNMAGAAENMIIYRSSTQTYSTWVMKLWDCWTRAANWLRIGRRNLKKASSITLKITG